MKDQKTAEQIAPPESLLDKLEQATVAQASSAIVAQVMQQVKKIKQKTSDIFLT